MKVGDLVKFRLLVLHKNWGVNGSGKHLSAMLLGQNMIVMMVLFTKSQMLWEKSI